MGCILFHFYIKPQLYGQTCLNPRVVSYSISTSNHNITTLSQNDENVVSYSISTSNHNKPLVLLLQEVLYLIPFLHQTTTLLAFSKTPKRCILFHFYIKPQPLNTS